jgi:hypothetical protein
VVVVRHAILRLDRVALAKGGLACVDARPSISDQLDILSCGRTALRAELVRDLLFLLASLSEGGGLSPQATTHHIVPIIRVWGWIATSS